MRLAKFDNLLKISAIDTNVPVLASNKKERHEVKE